MILLGVGVFEIVKEWILIHIYIKRNFYEIITFIYDSHSFVVLLSACNTATQVTKVQKNGETTLKLVLCKGITMYKRLKLKKEM